MSARWRSHSLWERWLSVVQTHTKAADGEQLPLTLRFLCADSGRLMQRCRYTPESVSNASRSPPTWGHDTLRLRSCSCCWHRWWAASRTRPLHSFAWHNNGTPSLRSSALTLSDSASVISLCTVGNTFPWVGFNRAVPQDCCTLGISASATIE